MMSAAHELRYAPGSKLAPALFCAAKGQATAGPSVNLEVLSLVWGVGPPLQLLPAAPLARGPLMVAVGSMEGRKRVICASQAQMDGGGGVHVGYQVQNGGRDCCRYSRVRGMRPAPDYGRPSAPEGGPGGLREFGCDPCREEQISAVATRQGLPAVPRAWFWSLRADEGA